MSFTITTTAFENGATIPKRHSCEGEDISPPLRWEGEPKDTVSFALIMEDPDAPGGTFVHWIVYNLPADCHELEMIIPIEKNLKNGAVHAKNDFGKYGYRGPCPPAKDGEHRYFFRIYALRKKIPKESITGRESFYNQLKGQIIDEAEYMGRYKI